MTEVNVTLSRAHKIVERITREIDVATSELRRSFEPVAFNVEHDLIAIEQRQEKVKETESVLNELYQALILTRTAISKANSKTDIHSLLAKKAVLKKQLESLRSVVESNNSHSIVTSKKVMSKESAQEYMKRLEKAESIETIYVSVINEDQKDGFKKVLKNLKSETDAVSDEINNINARTKIKLTYSDRVSELIGV